VDKQLNEVVQQYVARYKNSGRAASEEELWNFVQLGVKKHQLQMEEEKRQKERRKV
jgi:hypothetical protein